jgi:hypothetical protein
MLVKTDVCLESTSPFTLAKLTAATSPPSPLGKRAVLVVARSDTEASLFIAGTRLKSSMGILRGMLPRSRVVVV